MTLKLSFALLVTIIRPAIWHTTGYSIHKYRDTNYTAFENQIERGIDTYLNKGLFTKDLTQTLGIFPLRKILASEPKYSTHNGLLCSACNAFISGILKARQQGASKEQLFNFARAICVNLHIQAEHVCEGAIDLNLDPIMYIMDNAPSLDGTRVCSILLQFAHCEAKNPSSWEIDIHPGKSTPHNPAGGTALNILHLTDIHYDPLYAEGTHAHCDYPMCCQFDSGLVENKDDEAHYWSEYHKCDVSSHLLNDSLRQITEKHELDFVYYTGDIISHRVWSTSVRNNTEDLIYVYGVFKKYFKNIPVFPIMGNHEPHPLNGWAPNEISQGDISTSWIFEVAAKEWTYWLGEECKDTLLAGGYYTKLVKTGFRIVALNSNVAYTFNWWLWFDDGDVYGQLKWLEKILFQAEQNKENVHILSHIPSGDSTAYVHWTNQLIKIVLRYQHIITGIFNGHTHRDELIVYHNDDDTPVKVVAYNGGSLTPYSNRNPNYRILKVDDRNYDVLDYDQWMYSVAEVNKNDKEPPVWYKLYSFKEAYGVKSLFGEDVADLVKRMAEEPNKKLLKQYLRFVDREGPSSKEPCDENCMKAALKALVVPVYGQDKYSKKIMELWKYNIDG